MSQEFHSLSFSSTSLFTSGMAERYRSDPAWKDLILFYEYFDGDTGRGLGASHQTGWTAIVANCLQLMAERC